MKKAHAEFVENAGQPEVGSSFPARTLMTFEGEVVPLPDPKELVHLQLRRFAGCPICNLHLRSFVLRSEELRSAGIVEVAVFHSTAKELGKTHTGVPFAVVPDPQKLLYAELGIRTSMRAMLHPRAMAAGTKALLKGAAKHASVGALSGSQGLPGDFLISPTGMILDLYRGSHADDHWSVDQVIELARAHKTEIR